MKTPQKKMDLSHNPQKRVTPSRILMVFSVILLAILVVGALVFVYEWDKLKKENNSLSEQLNAQNTTSEVNEAKNSNETTNASNTTPTNTPSNTTTEKTDDTKSVSQVKIYLVAVGDEGKSGDKIGCGDSVVSVTRNISATTKPLEAAMKELLSLKTRDYGESGLMTALYQSNLQVKSVALSNGAATIKLSGTVASGGTCDDPRIVAQLTSTALQFSSVKTVNIFVNDVPLDQLF